MSNKAISWVIFMRTANVSIDDTLNSLDKLSKSEIRSIFDVDTFAYFKNLHQKYGVVVSFYCFLKNRKGYSLENVTDKFRDEFIKNSSWLRFGVHSTEYSAGFADGEQGEKQFKDIYNQLVRIVGKESIDLCFRPHYFKFSGELLKELSAQGLAKGVHCPDDNRPCGLLDTEKAEMIKSGYYLKDDLIYTRSQTRLELVDFDNLSTFLDHVKSLQLASIFTHEIYLEDKKITDGLEQICKELTKEKYTWAFPMDLF